jgi:hypothetical protein
VSDLRSELIEAGLLRPRTPEPEGPLRRVHGPEGVPVLRIDAAGRRAAERALLRPSAHQDDQASDDQLAAALARRRRR